MTIKIKIQETAKRRGVENATQLWKLIGGSQETTAQLWKGEFKMIALSTLEKLCTALNCKIADLIEYEGE